MPTLVAEGLSHEDFHAHVYKHNHVLYEGTGKRGVALFHDEPSAPQGVGHLYYKASTHPPATASQSFWAMPDLLFACALVVAVGMQLAFCWSYGWESTQDSGNDAVAVAETDSRSQYQAVVFGGVCFAALLSVFFVSVLVNCGAGIIKCLVFTCDGLMLLVAMACVANALPKLAFSFASFAIAIGVYFYRNNHLFDFTGACFDATRAVINSHHSCAIITSIVLFFQGCWVMVFSMALVGLQVQMLDDGANSETYFFMVWVCICAVYWWGQATMKNIVVATTAGTTSDWWYDNRLENDTWWAFWRALTTSFGAIAFGSFFVNAVQITACILHNAWTFCNSHRFFCAGKLLLDAFACVLSPAMPFLVQLSKEFTGYSFVLVGIYGHPFNTAGRRVKNVFGSKGMVPIEEGSLVSMLLWFGSVCVALTTGAVAAMIAYSYPEISAGIGYPVSTAMLSGCAVGHGVASIMFGVVEAANAAVFLSFIENPWGIYTYHPEEYLKLHRAWLAMGRAEVKHDPNGQFSDAEKGGAKAKAAKGDDVVRPAAAGSPQGGGGEWEDGAEDTARMAGGGASPDKKNRRSTESVDRPPTKSMARGGPREIEMTAPIRSGPQGTL